MMRIAVLGGGVIGLSVAWRLADAGHRVELYDDHPGQGASHAGAGMLAPAGEAWFGEEQLTRLGLAALRQWPDFAARLQDASGIDVGLRTEGSLLVGVDDADAATLDRVHGLLSQHGIEAERLTQRRLRRIEPTTAPGLRRAILTRSDLSVNNRQVVRALRVAADLAGVVSHQDRADVVPGGVAVRAGGGRAAGGRRAAGDHRTAFDRTAGDRTAEDRAAGVRDPGGGRFDGRRAVVRATDYAVVVAAGAELGAVAGLPAHVANAVRPVKGQILRLRADPSLVTHTVRGLVRGDAVYLVPRTDGELVVGATSEEMGHDVRLTVDGVFELLRRGIALVPGVRECELVEAIARSRPGTADNLPLIGPVDDDVFVAGGHYRAGFLLAPLTAEAIAAYVEDRPAPEGIAVCTPERLRIRDTEGAPGP